MDLTTNKRTLKKMVTARAPVNIAVIKYWGKRDEKLILPLNSSVSSTLSMDQMCAKTTVAISEHFQHDRLWLNGKEEDISNPRIQNCLREFRNLLLAREGPNCPFLNCKIHICSENDFPTAAGLASSAAGYACLVFTLGQAFGMQDIEFSKIARQGSGSACRSLAGGFVLWEAGECNDGSDSIAHQIVKEDHWPQIRILVLVVNEAQKGTTSTSGMQCSVDTSTLLSFRCKHIVPDRLQQIQESIRQKDFHRFAELTMKDSNQFHAICQDTYPPIRYMNDISFAIIDLVHKYNNLHGTNKVAYTFDAGPNACLYMLESDVDEVASLIKTSFPPANDKPVEKFSMGLPIKWRIQPKDANASLQHKFPPGAIKYIIHTRIGGGPEVLQDHLLNDYGLPKVS